MSGVRNFGHVQVLLCGTVLSRDIRADRPLPNILVASDVSGVASRAAARRRRFRDAGQTWVLTGVTRRRFSQAALLVAARRNSSSTLQH